MAFGAVAAAVALNAGLHTVVHCVLLKPLPFRAPERLGVIRLDLKGEAGRFALFNLEQFRRLKDSSGSWERLEAFTSSSSRIQEGGLEESLSGWRVGADFFSMLGLQPRLGRSFSGEEVTGGAKVVIISESFHQARLGGREDVLGTELKLGEENYTIIGVLPQTFRVFQWFQPDLYLPLTPVRSGTDSRSVDVVGRLRPHTSFSQAQAEARAIVSSWPENRDDRVAGVHALHDVNFARYADQLWMLVSAGFLILLLASLNAGALLLGNEIRSRRRVQVQLALGAGRRRLAWQAVVNNLIFALVSGVAGLLLVVLTLPLWSRFIPSSLPRVDDLQVSPSVVVVSIALSAGAGLLASLFPVWTSLKLSSAPVSVVRGSQLSRGENRSFQFLMAAEVALAMTLCVGAGLLLTSFFKVLSTGPGFQPERLHSLVVKLPRDRFAEPDSRIVAVREVMDSLRKLPQVEAVSVSLSLPFSGLALLAPYSLSGSPDAQANPEAVYSLVGGDFFSVMNIPLLRGRLFSLQDLSGKPSVAILSQSLADRLWPEQQAVGNFIAVKELNEFKKLKVVGVVGDVRQRDLVSGVQDVIYAPLARNPQFYATFVVRGLPRQPLREEDLKRAVGVATPGLRWDGSQSVLREIRQSYSQQQFLSLLVALFALSGVVTSLTGLYSTVRFSVQRRMPEWGIRTALGASPSQLLGHASKQSLVVIFGGVAAGLFLSLSLTNYLRAWLYTLEPTNITIIGCVVGFVLVTSAVASVMPARKAMHLDVLKVINAE